MRSRLQQSTNDENLANQREIRPRYLQNSIDRGLGFELGRLLEIGEISKRENDNPEHGELGRMSQGQHLENLGTASQGQPLD